MVFFYGCSIASSGVSICFAILSLTLLPFAKFRIWKTGFMF